MKKSAKIILAGVIAIASIISILAIATHLRESAEDAGKQGPENETPTQALKETLSGGKQSEANENGENEAAENGK
jgi:Flp pilus assembly protein CpaB